MQGDAEAKVLAVMTSLLAGRAGTGRVATERVLQLAHERYGLQETETLQVLDRLVIEGRIHERDGSWSLRPQLGRVVSN